MALNKLMHPRNIYKNKKPDFKALAIKYPEFRQHAIQDLQGKVHLDFKKVEGLRALTWALLKDDWGLDMDLPPDRLVPTIPLRLNYLLWLEDLLDGQTHVRGVDIGTGSSCVYPLLGAKKNKWSFLSSEADPYNYSFAAKNVEKNGLQDLVKVVKVDPTSGLNDLLTSEPSDTKYAFCMCNPPFFANNLEAWGVTTSRSEDRPEPRGATTAAPNESIAPGGEVSFVRRMIEDSLKLQDRVRIYTSMLGKKTSLVPLKEELRKHGITNFGITEFCQGRTMRWGLGWTFDITVKFPKAPSKLQKEEKPKPPISYKIPRQLSLQPELDYSVPDVGSRVMRYLDDLKVIYEPEKSTPEILEIEMVAVENTWSHQRRKRRQHTKGPGAIPNKLPCSGGRDAGSASTGGGEPSHTDNTSLQSQATSETKTLDSNATKLTEKETKSENSEKNPGNSEKNPGNSEKNPGNSEKNPGNSEKNPENSEKNPENSQKNPENSQKNPENSQKKEESESKSMGTSGLKAGSPETGKASVGVAGVRMSQQEVDRLNMSLDDVDEYLFRCKLAVKKAEGNVVLEMTWADGENLELMHQVMQFFKNKLK